MSTGVAGEAPAGNIELFRAQAEARRRQAGLRLGLGLGFPVLLLLAWQACSVAGVLDTRFFPAPSTILASAVHLLQSADHRAELLGDIGATLRRVLAGFVLGSVAGIVLGTVMALSLPVRFAVAPLVGITYPTPKLAVFPLLIVLLGIGDGSKIAVVALGAFW